MTLCRILIQIKESIEYFSAVPSHRLSSSWVHANPAKHSIRWPLLMLQCGIFLLQHVAEHNVISFHQTLNIKHQEIFVPNLHRAILYTPPPLHSILLQCVHVLGLFHFFCCLSSAFSAAARLFGRLSSTVLGCRNNVLETLRECGWNLRWRANLQGEEITNPHHHIRTQGNRRLLIRVVEPALVVYLDVLGKLDY